MRYTRLVFNSYSQLFNQMLTSFFRQRNKGPCIYMHTLKLPSTRVSRFLTFRRLFFLMRKEKWKKPRNLIKQVGTFVRKFVFPRQLWYLNKCEAGFKLHCPSCVFFFFLCGNIFRCVAWKSQYLLIFFFFIYGTTFSLLCE